MANNITRTPLFIDTAGAGMIITANVRVRSIRWVGATTAGHICEIQDVDNRVLWRSIAAGPNYVEVEAVERNWPRGFKVPTLGSGVLLIDATGPSLA